MITLVTGTLGGGKSYYAVREMAHYLATGKCVATNCALVPDLAERVAKHQGWLTKATRRKDERVAELGRRYFYAPDFDTLRRVKLCGEGEGRGLLVIDEGQGFLNARMWSKGDRADNIKFFTHARKLGWHVLLISQDSGNLDKQIRVLCQAEVRVKNLRRLRFMGIPPFPFNLFLAVKRLINEREEFVVKRQFYRLGWQKHLYDTFELHEADDESAGEPSAVLPRPVEDALADSTGAQYMTDGFPSGNLVAWQRTQAYMTNKPKWLE